MRAFHLPAVREFLSHSCLLSSAAGASVLIAGAYSITDRSASLSFLSLHTAVDGDVQVRVVVLNHLCLFQEFVATVVGENVVNPLWYPCAVARGRCQMRHKIFDHLSCTWRVFREATDPSNYDGFP